MIVSGRVAVWKSLKVLLLSRKFKKALQFVQDTSYLWPESYNPVTVAVVLECLQPSGNALSDVRFSPPVFFSSQIIITGPELDTHTHTH